MKILITGSTGFVGKTLVPFFSENKTNKLYLLVRNVSKAESLFSNNDVDIIDTNKNDWTDQVRKINPDTVLHLAAFFTGRHDFESIDNIIDSNIKFTTILLEVVSQTTCKHFINIGTFSEFFYGGGEYAPNNLYSASKTSERAIIRYYQTISQWNWINVIVYSPYGRRNAYKKVIDYMADSFTSKQPVDFTKGEQILDFIHVDDMADFFYALICRLNQLKDKYYEIHLGTGVGHSIREVSAIMEKIWNKKMNANWGGRNYSSQDIMYAVAPINKTISLLNWHSKISLEEGLRIYYNDLKLNEL